MIMSLMSADDIREARRYLKLENKKHSTIFVNIPQKEWPDLRPDNGRQKIVQVLRNRDFLVQIYEQDGYTRLSILRTEIDSRGNYLDRITWDELQKVKHDVGFGNCDAVEVYPADRDVVNVANIRHLWILKEPLPFIWRAKD